eukprot:2090620-Pyramimonas_sp.AAC.1
MQAPPMQDAAFQRPKTKWGPRVNKTCFSSGAARHAALPGSASPASVAADADGGGAFVDLTLPEGLGLGYRQLVDDVLVLLARRGERVGKHGVAGAKKMWASLHEEIVALACKCENNWHGWELRGRTRRQVI